MAGGLAEKLVVPEPHGHVAEQLAAGHHEGRVPEDVVEARGDAPGAEGVKEHGLGRAGLVGVVLVKKMDAGVLGVEEQGQLAVQRLHLLLGQHPDAGEVTVLPEKRHLLVGEPVWLPLLRGLGPLKQVRHQAVPGGEVLYGGGGQHGDERVIKVGN